MIINSVDMMSLMAKKIETPSLSHFLKHDTKRETLIKFIMLIFIVVSYFVYISLKFGTRNGLLVTVITWSFFIFCTPIAKTAVESKNDVYAISLICNRFTS